jgi:hypothetical protein
MRGRKKRHPDDAPVQIVFRVPASLHVALQEAMDLLNVDMSNLLRMMISEHIGEYIARGKKGKERLAQPQKTLIEQQISTPLGPAERCIDLE